MPVRHLPEGVTDLNLACARRCGAHLAGEEVFEGFNRTRIGESQVAPGIRGGRPGERVTIDLAAELEGVLSTQDRNVIQELNVGIGTDVLGPGAAQPQTEVGDGNDGESIEDRIRDARVQAVVLPIGWRNVLDRRNFEVVAVELLDIARIPSPRFVHHIGVRSPGPAP